VDLGNKVLQHLLGDIEIRDDAVAQWTDGDDVSRSPPDHLFGLGADGQYTLAFALDGDDGRLVDDDSLTADHNQGVSCPQVDADVT
jgi:hypothetical protein